MRQPPLKEEAVLPRTVNRAKPAIRLRMVPKKRKKSFLEAVPAPPQVKTVTQRESSTMKRHKP